MTTQQYHQEISEMIKNLKSINKDNHWDIEDNGERSRYLCPTCIHLGILKSKLQTALAFCEDDLKRYEEDIEFLKDYFEKVRYKRLETAGLQILQYPIQQKLEQKQSLRSEIIKRIEEIKGALQ